MVVLVYVCMIMGLIILGLVDVEGLLDIILWYIIIDCIVYFRDGIIVLYYCLFLLYYRGVYYNLDLCLLG